MCVKLTVRVTWSLVSHSRAGALLKGESRPGRTVAVVLRDWPAQPS